MQLAAGTLLVLPDGRLVMQRRTDDAPTNPGMLSFFGGGIEGDETPEAAARRELAEETSLDVEALTFTLACEIFLPAGLKGNTPFKAVLFRVSIPDTNFEVFEGKGAEAYFLEEFNVRDDLSPVAIAVLEKLSGDNNNGTKHN